MVSSSAAKRKIEIFFQLCILSIIRYSKVIGIVKKERRPSFFCSFFCYSCSGLQYIIRSKFTWVLGSPLKQHHKAAAAHKKSLESFVLSEIVSSTKQEAHPRFRGGDAPISPLYPFHHQSLSLEAASPAEEEEKAASTPLPIKLPTGFFCLRITH